MPGRLGRFSRIFNLNLVPLVYSESTAIIRLRSEALEPPLSAAENYSNSKSCWFMEGVGFEPT
jgi:hypothetical protein